MQIRAAPTGAPAGPLPQKKRLQPKLEPDDRAEAKSQVLVLRMGGGYAPDRWIVAEGGGFGFDPVSQEAGPREEDTERLHQRRLRI